MDLSSQFDSLYKLQDYSSSEAIAGVEIVELKRFNDDGGSMTELLRLSSGNAAGLEGFSPAQINYSRLESGVIKAFHIHRRQTDAWFVPPEDRILLVLVDVRAGSPTEGGRMRFMLGDTRSRLVRIPPGVAHGCRNVGRDPASILYLTDVQFSTVAGECDEGRLPWDFVGEDVWDVAWE